MGIDVTHADPASGTYTPYVLLSVAALAVGLFGYGSLVAESVGYEHIHHPSEIGLSAILCLGFLVAIMAPHWAQTIARQRRQAFKERGLEGLRVYNWQRDKNLLHRYSGDLFQCSGGGRWREQADGSLSWEQK